VESEHNEMMKILLTMIVVFAVPIMSRGSTWRGLSPLHSDCSDVKRTLRISTCTDALKYETADETVILRFVIKPCTDGWNVPPWTLLSIVVEPKTRISTSMLPYDLATFRKMKSGDFRGADDYRNDELGLALTVLVGGVVQFIDYIPTTADESLRLTGAKSKGGIYKDERPYPSKFDAFGPIPPAEERKRLWRFAEELKSWTQSEAFVVIYSGRNSSPRTVAHQKIFIKEYLTSVSMISTSAISFIDGGFREELTVELWSGRQGSRPPDLAPTVCKEEIDKNRKKRVK
jgi:hypothetical protein